MKWSLRSSTLATIIYADMFNYPLTGREVWHWLFGVSATPNKIFTVLHSYVSRSSRNTNGEQALYYLVGRKRIIKTRYDRSGWSRQKWEKIKRLAWWLRNIPTVQLIGVTGSLALDNSEMYDDIDVFVIAQSGMLWITRFLVVSLTELIAKRRRPKDQEVRDSICLNMFITEDRLTMPTSEQDFYTAHELLQMRPIWEKEGVYKKFLEANGWVKKFLPNAWSEKMKNEAGSMNHKENKKQHVLIPSMLHTSYFMLQFFEQLARRIQLWYMRHRRTTEIITDTMVRFHPKDARNWIREEYFGRLVKYKVPLDKRLLSLLK